MTWDETKIDGDSGTAGSLTATEYNTFVGSFESIWGNSTGSIEAEYGSFSGNIITESSIQSDRFIWDRDGFYANEYIRVGDNQFARHQIKGIQTNGSRQGVLTRWFDASDTIQAQISTGNDNYVLNNFGIGTPSPSEALEVAGDVVISGTNQRLSIDDSVSGDNIATFGYNGSELFISRGTTGGEDDILINSSGDVLLAANGFVGIGTASPSQPLDVSGNINTSGALAISGSDTIGTGFVLSSEGTYKRIQTYGGQPLVLNELGNNVGINNQNPTHALTVTGDGSFSGSLIASDWSDVSITESQISDLQNYALDGSVVHTTGDETINGSKTFTSDVNFDKNYLRDVKIWYDFYDGDFRTGAIVPGLNDTAYYGVERGYSVSANRSPTDGNFSNLFNLTNSSTRWTNVGSGAGSQVELTIDWSPSEKHIQRIDIAHGWRDSQMTDYKIESYHDNDDNGSFEWSTEADVTGNADYLVSHSISKWRVQKVKITVTKAGVGTETNKLVLGTIQLPSAVNGKGTGHFAEVGPNTFFGDQDINGAGSFTGTVTASDFNGSLDAGSIFTGTLSDSRLPNTFSTKEINGSLVGSVYSTVEEFNNSTGSGPVTIDWNKSNHQTITLTDNVTLSFTNPNSPGRFDLRVVGSSGAVVTWPSDVYWGSATAPALTQDSNTYDIITFRYRNGSYDGDFIGSFG